MWAKIFLIVLMFLCEDSLHPFEYFVMCKGVFD